MSPQELYDSIDALNKSSIFNIESHSVVIKNLNFKDCYISSLATYNDYGSVDYTSVEGLLAYYLSDFRKDYSSSEYSYLENNISINNGKPIININETGSLNISFKFFISSFIIFIILFLLVGNLSYMFITFFCRLSGNFLRSKKQFFARDAGNFPHVKQAPKATCYTSNSTAT